jgi:hypothetical protein
LIAQPLGDPPGAAAGLAVWCHHAQIIETMRHRHPLLDNVMWNRLSQACAGALAEIGVADAANADLHVTTNDPEAWAACAALARAFRSGLYDDVARRSYPDAHLDHEPEIDNDIGL